MERTYQAYGLTNYRNIRQITRLNKEELQAIEVVGRVLPFKTNNYVVEELIDWERIDTDPIFTLNFPRREMLSKKHFSVVSKLLAQEVGKEEFIAAVNAVRLELNPNPAGQDHNVPMLGDIRLKGIQHKYRETVLFFPAQGQTCHAYCSFCFRWPQFSGMNELKFAMKETDLLLKYLRLHPQVTDVLFTGGVLDTYRVLRTTNPSPYMFYFSSDDVEIAGASPETLVKVEDGEVRTFPLAGTRPRGKSYEEDQRLEKELLADEKERAEHNMLVDLGRNDLGKICDFGTVEVEKYMSIERYSHVMHIGSTVKGQLRKDKTAVDAIDSVLPAGTLSGAPKLRACQIINELENNKRGIYGGAIGYLDFTGNMDTCIAIRLAFKKNGKVFVRSGAGIVADSVPEKEHQECINKAKAVMVALAEAEGGSNL